MQPEGWIPREHFIGEETRRHIEPRWWVQNPTHANPPTLLLALESLMDHGEASPGFLVSSLPPFIRFWANMHLLRLLCGRDVALSRPDSHCVLRRRTAHVQELLTVSLMDRCAFWPAELHQAQGADVAQLVQAHTKGRRPLLVQVRPALRLAFLLLPLSLKACMWGRDAYTCTKRFDAMAHGAGGAGGSRQTGSGTLFLPGSTITPAQTRRLPQRTGMLTSWRGSRPCFASWTRSRSP